jgi:hypothetical protein
MTRFSIRSILALLLAVTLPLQGLAFVVQSVATPGHFHPSGLAEGLDHDHAQSHGHTHKHTHAHALGSAAPHAHALDDDDVVYVIGDNDPHGTAGFKLPPLDGVPRAALPLPAAAPGRVVPVAAASTGPLRSRTVEPPRRPPRG